MKKILTLLFVSVLGGVFTLSAYKLFVEEEKATISSAELVQPNYVPVNYTSNTNLKALEEVPDFIVAAENTIHTVVHVKNMSISNTYTAQDWYYGRTSPKAQIGSGSGVIISPDGHIITNNHVIKGADELSVTLNDNKVYKAQLVGTDEKTDIALLKIEADEDLPYTTFADSDNAKIGEWVLAVGNPFNLTSTVTAGIISAKSRDLTGQNSQSFIQTDAAVNPGNSGGALVNTNGQLIGINTAISSQTGSYVGYSFAVPSNIAKKVIEDIIEYGNVQDGILGISPRSLTANNIKEIGTNETEGIYVEKVFENSGAFKAGIKEGDIIKKIDAVDIKKFSDLGGYLSTKRPSDIVDVTVLRNGYEKTLPVILSKRELTEIDFFDMTLKDIPEKYKKVNNIENGVFVIDNDNYQLFKKLGVQPGYIITDVNDIKINTINDINRLKSQLGETDYKNGISKIGVINLSGQRERLIFR